MFNPRYDQHIHTLLNGWWITLLFNLELRHIEPCIADITCCYWSHSYGILRYLKGGNKPFGMILSSSPIADRALIPVAPFKLDLWNSLTNPAIIITNENLCSSLNSAIRKVLLYIYIYMTVTYWHCDSLVLEEFARWLPLELKKSKYANR